MPDLYDEDIVLWSERQAELLRQHAATARVNDAIDWANIIEEIESVGREQVHIVTAMLRRALIQMLKARAWPKYLNAPSWRANAIGFRIEAADRFTQSMRQRLDVNSLYCGALRCLPTAFDGQPPLPVPLVSPWTLDELLSEDDAL